MTSTAAAPQVGRQELMGGLAKGLAILESFAPDRPTLTVTEAAQASGTTPAAARRCLLTLVELGYLLFDGKHYSPTPRVVRLTRAYTGTASLPALAQPSLVTVRDTIGQSASLAVLDGGRSLFVARAESARLVTAGVRLGTTLPLLGSATGRVLATGLDADALAAVLAREEVDERTPHSVTDPAAVLELVEQARRDGVAYTDQELEMGVRTMAVPVRDSAGSVRAAMSAVGFAGQVTLEHMATHYLPVLLEEAGRLGKML